MSDTQLKSWRTWSDWNDEYTQLLRKRNAAHRKASLLGATQRQLDALQRAELAVSEHSEHPNRPASRASFVF